MGDMKWVLTVLLPVVVIPLLLAEFTDWCPRLADRIARRASRRMPAEHQQRCAEEWENYLAEIPGRLSKLLAALAYWIRVPLLRRAVGAPAFQKLQVRRAAVWERTAALRWQRVWRNRLLTRLLYSAWILHRSSRAKQIKEAASVLGYPPKLGDDLANMLPPPMLGKEFPLAEAYILSAELRAAKADPDARAVLELAEKLGR